MKNKLIYCLFIFLFAAITSNSQIVQAEYFWDTDPGIGLGTVINAADGNLDEAIELLLSDPTIVPSVGLHKFCVRIKDNNGNWSPVFSSVLSVESISRADDKQIIQAEYFWDTDPGNGLGTPILAMDGNLDEALEIILNAGVSQPAAGVHKFCIRIKDYENNWGPVFSSVISIENLNAVVDKQIIQAEYFWDTDPGLGSGTTILALDGNLDEALEIALNTGVSQPAVGLHKFNIRIKDFDNQWSPIFSSVVSIENLNAVLDKQIIQAEYFWDIDPGVGLGTSILALDGNLDEAIELVLNSGISQPSVGLHKFCVRIKDFDNQWSPVFSSVVSIENLIAVSDKQIVQAEYFWDTDPGPGLGSSILALDGNLDEALEIALNSNGSTFSLSLGAHALYVRIKDFDNNWSPVFGQVVEITDCMAPDINLGADETLCNGSNNTLDAGIGFDTYLWSTGETTQTIVVSSPGTYSVIADHSTGCSIRDTVVFFEQEYVDLGTDITSCSGSSLSFDAGLFASYNWSTFQTTQVIFVSPTSVTTYGVTVSDAAGCTSTDAITVNINILPDVDLGEDQDFCFGESTNLDAGIFDSYLWTGGSTNQTLLVATTGTYSVTVTDANFCQNSDAIFVDVHPLPTVDLGENLVICSGISVTLDAGVFASYEWSDASTGQTLIASTPGTYSVTVTDLYLCINSDEVIVSSGVTPIVNLGNDTAVCEGNSVVINAGAFDSYIWSNGSSLQTISVSVENTYSVTVTNSDNCTNSDTVFVGIIDSPNVNLGNDTIICSDAFLILNAGAGFDSYLWFNGSVGQTILVDTAGFGLGNLYCTVTVTDNGCQTFEDIVVTFDICDSNSEILATEDNVLIYPNPATDIVNISNVENSTIELLSITGKLLFAEKTENSLFKLSVSNYAEGVYLLKIIKPDKVITKALIIK